MSSSYPSTSSEQVELPRAIVNYGTMASASSSNITSTSTSSSKSATHQENQEVLFDYETSLANYHSRRAQDLESLPDDATGNMADDEDEGTLVGSVRADSIHSISEEGASEWDFLGPRGGNLRRQLPSDLERRLLRLVPRPQGPPRTRRQTFGDCVVFIIGTGTILMAMVLLGIIVAGLFTLAYGGW